MEDLARFGVDVGDLLPPSTGFVDRSRRGAQGGGSPQLRALLAFEAARARRMLDEGSLLIASLKGRLRFAVAGFVAGGHAALDALAAADFDPFADRARPTRRARLGPHLARLLLNAGWPL
jgi:phytoene/squalene synthetase